MVSIPERLKGLDLRFVRVAEKSKGVYDHGWQKRGGANFAFGDEELREHLKTGGNYGVMSGWDSDIIVIDLDDGDRIIQLGALDKFPNTLTIRSGNDKKNAYHLYYHTDATEYFGKKHQFYDPAKYFSNNSEDKKEAHLGEVYTPGCGAQTVGPGSIHPDSGKAYEIMKDRDMEPAFLSREALNHFFATLVTPGVFKTSIPKDSKKISISSLTDQLGLRITDYAIPEDIKFQKASGEVQGSHPIHGSSTGTNFSVDPVKNVWFCHRCGVGGDPVSWIAYSNGWADEGEKVEGEAFKKVVEYLKEHGYRKELEKLEARWQSEQCKLTANIRRGCNIACSKEGILDNMVEQSMRDYAAFLATDNRIHSDIGIYQKLVTLNNSRRVNSKLDDDLIYDISRESWINKDDTTRQITFPEGYEDYARVNIRGEVKLRESTIANHIVEQFNAIGYSEQLYVYKDGIYVDGAVAVNKEVKRVYDGVSCESAITEPQKQVRAHILSHPDAGRESYPFNPERQKDSVLIPVEDCVLEVFSDGVVVPHKHDPAYYFNYKIPVKYNPDAGSEFVDNMLAGYVGSEKRDALYQIPAQALIQMSGAQGTINGGSIAKKSYLLQGRTNAGKSTYLDWLVSFFGEDAVAHVSLHDLCGGNRFKLADLEGSPLNIYDDLSAIPLVDVDSFKNVTGSYFHSIEKKNIQPYNARLYAVHVFSCNQPPDLKDPRDPGAEARAKGNTAFWDRWEYIAFESDFEKDPFWLVKLYTDANKSAFLNRVIEMIAQILREGMVYNSTASEVLENWELDSDPISGFVKSEFVEDEDELARYSYDKEQMFVAAKEYLSSRGVSADQHCRSLTILTRRLESLGFLNSRLRGKHVYKAHMKPKPGAKYAPQFL